MKKKVLSLILALLMLSSATIMTACGESGVNNEETKAQSSNTPADGSSVESIPEEELTELQRRQLIPDDLPEAKYNGQIFRVLTSDNEAVFNFKTEIYAEELTGDACNDAVYNRNVKIEDRFDVKIEVGASSTSAADIKTFVTAGTNDYQVVGYYDFSAYTPINAGVVLNWMEAPVINLEKPWHNKLANDGATINNKLYAICSDLSITSMTFTHAIFANLDMSTDYGYDASTLYGIVKEGKWTLDEFGKIIEGMYIDENGNGKADTNDQYGFGYQITNPADVWLTSCGGKVMTVDEGGKSVTLTFMNERLISAYEKLYDLHINNKGFEKLATQYDEEKYFPEGKLVFAPMRFSAAYNQLRTMDDAYTMLPFPKYDEEQPAYYTNADDKFTTFSLPLTAASDLEFICTIFEVLCAESYKTVYPEYYDTALKGKYSTDAETAEMVELIMAGRAFDFSFQFGESYFQRLCYFIRDKLLDGTQDITSAYKKSEKALKKGLEKKFADLYEITVNFE